MIEVTHLSRSYGNFKAVQAVSFRIEHGEVVGLLGHNGAGKTTIMKMLTGFLEASSGQIILNQQDIRTHRTTLQRQIGYLPENCPIYPEMTVLDYLLHRANLLGINTQNQAKSVRQAIDRTQLNEKADQLIATLSRGYKQRVGVAQAILHEPKILILDEPTNGLDPSQIQHMRNLLKDLAQNATVILSTHILQEVQAICDRVLIIKQGRLALDRRLAELAQNQRLVIDLNQNPETAQQLWQKLAVEGVTPLGENQGIYRYSLNLANKTHEFVPICAKTAIALGFELHRLQTEQRDLESLFREIDSTNEEEQAHA